jgi:hypothetical protein
MTNLVYAGAGSVFPGPVQRHNMLFPARWPYSGETTGYPSSLRTIIMDWVPANYFSQWLPYNLQLDSGGADVNTGTIGALTAGPDGTTTACLLKDTTANSEHAFIAGMKDQPFIHFGTVRFAGVFKYAGRRIVMSLQTGSLSLAVVCGCRAVFDLYNGTVAVENTLFGTFTTTTIDPPLLDEWTLLSAQIRHVGNGWYLCSIEANANAGKVAAIKALYCKLLLDNGAGSDAESSTYVGNGTHGVYAWRSNLLPSRAWDLNNVTLFDDFDDDTMSQIDRYDTLESGFKWYVHASFPGYDVPAAPDFAGHMPPPPDSFSCSGSVLRWAHNVSRGIENVASLWRRPEGIPEEDVPTSDRQYTTETTGPGFTLPVLVECRSKSDLDDFAAAEHGGSGAMWSDNLSWLTTGRYSGGDPPTKVEIDFWETYPELVPLSFNSHEIPGFLDDSTPVLTGGVPATWTQVHPWLYGPTHQYPSGTIADYLGTRYFALTSTVVAGSLIPPPDDPTHWRLAVATDYDRPGAIPPLLDFREFHTFSGMWLPYDATTGEPGQLLMFHDGALANYIMAYGPDYPYSNFTSPTMHLLDSSGHTLYIGMRVRSTDEPGPIFYIDWARITQS